MNPKLSRRMLLRGAGGFALALPFLPSLLERGEARAGGANRPKRYVHFATDHGGVWGANMYPATPADATTLERRSYAGHEVRRAALAPQVANGRASLSPVLTGAADRLTPAMAAKMNVIRGLDYPWYLGHHTGGHMGNQARNDGNASNPPVLQPRRTIDQVMAWSPSFYSDLGSIKERALTLSGNLSFTYSNPSAGTGPIQGVVPTGYNSLEVFNKIFVPAEDPKTVRPPVVDRVYEDYKRLRDGNTRLSIDDRRRLDDHMQRMSELQRQLTATASCGSVTKPTEDTSKYFSMPDFGTSNLVAQDKVAALFNDVIVAAFICGTSRIATAQQKSIHAKYAGDWHQEIAHQAWFDDAKAQNILAGSFQNFFESAFLDLATKLDIPDGSGGTYLDDTLMVWSQECGPYTHDAQSLPIVTAGGASGGFRTGGYVDYRNINNVVASGYVDGAGHRGGEVTHTGLMYPQFLATVLQAIGVPKSEWEEPGGGYGLTYIGTGNFQKLYAEPKLVANLSEPLPFLAPA